MSQDIKSVYRYGPFIECPSIRTCADDTNTAAFTQQHTSHHLTLPLHPSSTRFAASCPSHATTLLYVMATKVLIPTIDAAFKADPCAVNGLSEHCPLHIMAWLIAMCTL